MNHIGEKEMRGNHIRREGDERDIVISYSGGVDKTGGEFETRVVEDVPDEHQKRLECEYVRIKRFCG